MRPLGDDLDTSKPGSAVRKSTSAMNSAVEPARIDFVGPGDFQPVHINQRTSFTLPQIGPVVVFGNVARPNGEREDVIVLRVRAGWSATGVFIDVSRHQLRRLFHAIAHLRGFDVPLNPPSGWTRDAGFAHEREPLTHGRLGTRAWLRTPLPRVGEGPAVVYHNDQQWLHSGVKTLTESECTVFGAIYPIRMWPRGQVAIGCTVLEDPDMLVAVFGTLLGWTFDEKHTAMARAKLDNAEHTAVR